MPKKEKQLRTRRTAELEVMRRCTLCGAKIDASLMHEHWVQKHPSSATAEINQLVGIGLKNLPKKQAAGLLKRKATGGEAEWSTCKVCGSPVKTKHLRRHMRKQHQQVYRQTADPPFRSRAPGRRQKRTAEALKPIAPEILQARKNSERKGHSSKSALPYVLGQKAPSMPLKRISRVQVFAHAWSNPRNLKLATEIVRENRGITLRGLVEAMCTLVRKGEIEYPYLWWVYPSPRVDRILHQDFNEVPFVRLDSRWQIAFPIKTVGFLVGAQGADSYEHLETAGYFVI